jgi:hypothetical protein
VEIDLTGGLDHTGSAHYLLPLLTKREYTENDYTV